MLGYFGVVDERLDYELIGKLAEANANWHVVIIGPPCKVDPATFPHAPNLHWLGRREYAQLPAYTKGFDVCLMPFALNEATKYISPTKTLEYMAGGKPVVSTAIADVVRNFTPIVQVAHSPEEFVDAVERAWRSPDATLIREGIERAAGSSWDATVDAMHRDIRDAIRVGTPARSAAHATATA